MTALARAKTSLPNGDTAGRLPWRSGIALGLVVGGGYLASLYGHTRTRVTIDINGVQWSTYTSGAREKTYSKSSGSIWSPGMW